MSQAFMESDFPLGRHPEAADIRRAVEGSLYGENANPSALDWSDDAIIYTRSSWSQIQEYLEDRSISLSPAEETDLIDFCSKYASLVDGEDDKAELQEQMKRSK